MKKNCVFICVLMGLIGLGFTVAAAFCFAYRQYGVGSIVSVMALVSFWVFAGYVYRESVRERFIARYRVRDYGGAKAILEKASSNHLLYPLLRIVLNSFYLRIALCEDDIAAAVKYAESLRRLGGEGWKYRTAYWFVLFNLDWSDVAAARTEYEAFRAACSQHEIYRGQLEILGAVFDHIDGRGGELPESVKKADYPILHRIVRKYC